jgi:HlyD family secretion protein
MIFGGKSSTDISIYKVEAKEFVQNVSLTGKVIAAKNVDMGFETSGRVSRVNFKVGDRVKKGQVIASLQNGDAISSLQKASAQLSQTQGGSRSEEIAIAQGDFIGAQNDVDLSRQSFEIELQNVYNKADEAIRSKVDNSFDNPRSVNPQFKYAIDQNPTLKQKLTDDRVKIGEMLPKWSGNNSITDIDQVKVYVSQIQSFINDVNNAISIVAEKSVSTDSNYISIQSQKTDISLARTNFTIAINSLNQAQISYKNKVTALNRAENNLRLKQNGGTQNEVAIQRASVTSAQAFVAKTIITAPFDGVITKVDVKEGEISSPNTPVISLLNDGEYQIETYVSENDIAKLKVDQTTKISLDAYGRDVFFEGAIISIDPAETIKDGVSTYRTKIQFIGKDERVKSGMTANIDIETDRRPDVLSIPQASIVLDKGIKKVYVLTSGSCIKNNSCSENFSKMKDVKSIEIKTGEINNNGDIEIISGLENNQIIIYGKK